MKYMDGSIFFLSSMYDEFTFEATVDLKSFDYLIKPASQSRLRRALNLCIANRHQTKDDIADEQIFIKEKNLLKRLDKSDIGYIVIRDRYCLIYSTSDNDLIQVRYAFKDMLKDYHLAHLSQVHRSIVLNLKKNIQL